MFFLHIPTLELQEQLLCSLKASQLMMLHMVWQFNMIYLRRPLGVHISAFLMLALAVFPTRHLSFATSALFVTAATFTSTLARGEIITIVAFSSKAWSLYVYIALTCKMWYINLFQTWVLAEGRWIGFGLSRRICVIVVRALTRRLAGETLDKVQRPSLRQLRPHIQPRRKCQKII